MPQVQAALSQYQSADKAAIEKELDETVRRIRSDGADPDTSPKVRDLRARLAEDAVDPDALEAEVYDHLYGFFRRYYSEGDFLGKRVYKRYLNVTTNLVSQWERGEKQPRGASLKLLTLVARNGIAPARLTAIHVRANRVAAHSGFPDEKKRAGR